MEKDYNIQGFKQENMVLRERIHSLEVNKKGLEELIENLKVRVASLSMIVITQLSIIATLYFVNK